MIELEPPFKLIYDEPAFVAYGGVGISDDGYYNSKTFLEETSNVLKGITDFLKRSYRVRGLIENDNKVLKASISPVIGEFDKRDYDLNIKYALGFESGKLIDRVCKRMLREKKDNAITRKISPNVDGFDIFHLLKDKFDPDSVMDLLTATESILLEVFNQQYSVLKSEISSPDYLERSIEISPPRNLEKEIPKFYIV